MTRSDGIGTGTMQFPGDPPKHPSVNENRLLFESVFTLGMQRLRVNRNNGHQRHTLAIVRPHKENKPCGLGRDYDLVFGCCLLNVLQFNQGTLKSIDKDSIEAHRLHQGNPPGVPKALPFLIIGFTTCWDVSLTRECQRCTRKEKWEPSSIFFQGKSEGISSCYVQTIKQLAVPLYSSVCLAARVGLL